MAAQWYYTVNRQQQGPVSWEALCQLAQSGTLQPTDLIWQEGMASWVKANTQGGLFASAALERGRRVDEDDPPRRRRYEEDDDRPARRPRRDDEDYGPDDDRPRRRPPRDEGMPVGVKIGLIIGGVVVLLLVVGVVLILVLRPGETVQGQFNVPGGAGLTFNDRLVNSDPIDRRMRGPCKIYRVNLVQGKTYTIELRSGNFDAYLRLETDNGREVAADDDSAGNLNSRIVYFVPAPGTYRVIATSLGGHGQGQYSLTIREAGGFK